MMQAADPVGARGERTRLFGLVGVLALLVVAFFATAPMRRPKPVPVSPASPAAPVTAAPSADAELLALAAHPPSDVEGMVRLASLYARSGKAPEAVQELERAIHQYPRSADALLALAQLMTSLGMKDRARDALLLCVQVDPKNLPAHINLAAMAVSVGWTTEAVSEAEQAARIDSKDPGAALSLAMAYYQSGTWPKAVEATKMAIQLSPNDPKLWLLLGQVESSYGMARYQDADAALRKALEQGGPNATVLDALGDVETKWPHPGHLERAEGYYKQELALVPQSQSAMMGLGAVYGQQGRVKEGIRMLESLGAQASAPGGPGTLPSGFKLALGQLYLRDGQVEKGRGFIEAAQKSASTGNDQASLKVGMNPTDAEAHFQHGLEMQSHHNQPDAILEFREALRLAPGKKLYRDKLIEALLQDGRRGDAGRIKEGKPLVPVTELAPM